MKKIIAVLLLFVTVFVGCTKENYTPEQNEVPISFTFHNIADVGNIQTRSFVDEVLIGHSCETPQIVYLQNYETGKIYTLDFSKESRFLIQPGAYKIWSRQGTSSSLDWHFRSKTAVPLEIQDIWIDSPESGKIRIGYSQSISTANQQTLNVRYAAIVVACKKSEVSYFRWWNFYEWTEENLLSAGEYYYYIFTVPDYVVLGGDQVHFDLTVEMGGTETTETTQTTIDIVKSSRGKFFVVSPNSKSYTSFSMNNVQEWENGFE